MMERAGCGKTNYLIQLSAQMDGFVVVDPKGDDLDGLLGQLPDERLDELVWVDPSEL